MKKFALLISALFVISSVSFGQSNDISIVKVMKWGLDYTIRLELSNDSIYVLNVKDLYQTDQTTASSEITYFPVNLNKEFLEQFKEVKSTVKEDENLDNLFKAVHAAVGGGWAHFINSILYSLETNQLNLVSPEMTRPVTDWKPDPITESYLRTKNWKFYVPMEQKQAKKEYKARKKTNQMAELEGIPQEFTDLLLSTSEKKYQALKTTGQTEKVARIDMVKIMMGSNFMSKDQIKYIRNSVAKAIQEYSIYSLPSVIIFKNFNAAVAMSLAPKGYKIEGVVFSDQESIDETIKNNRIVEITKIIDNINDANQKAIEKKLRKIYN